jgi:hypothetical protein
LFTKSDTHQTLGEFAIVDRLATIVPYGHSGIVPVTVSSLLISHDVGLVDIGAIWMRISTRTPQVLMIAISSSSSTSIWISALGISVMASLSV